MPSRSCGRLNFLSVCFLKLIATFTRYFRPVPPELPLSTLDLHTHPHNAVEIPGVPEDATENEQLVLSSHWQRELDLPRFRDVGKHTKSGAYSDCAQDSPEITASIKAAAFTSLFSVSPILPAQSPLLSMTPLPLVHMSSPTALHSSKLCPSLLDSEHGFEGGDVIPDSRPSLDQAIGELGKRRGFKGAPIFTPAASRRPSFLSLSSAFSPTRSPHPSPSTPRFLPSTPRTPLATVTNRMRTSTTKSPGKSPRSSAIQMEPSVSDELQQCYDLGDPFSVMGESLYIPEIVCASVPFMNLERFEVYWVAPPKKLTVRNHKTFFRAVEAASRTKPNIRDTNIYDMMVYNFQPQAKKIGKKKVRRCAAPLAFFKLPRVTPRPSTATTAVSLVFRGEEPRIRLPCVSFRRECEVLAKQMGSHPTLDFSRTLSPISFWESQEVIVNLLLNTTPPQSVLTRDSADITTDEDVTPTLRQSAVLENLFSMLMDELESSGQVRSAGSTELLSREVWTGAVAV
ncbi:hypothetical protein DFH07DRAFT_937158 [Mycena maculata]|uniref:Uncharacterized protein n=1 Tax=Mycena maculata TaxID=230809 RepID=A0AAD7K0T0_9AGAR|nr:hypothetical protein DFH07DRAFT_937158 [Mycena maculata]